MRNCVNKIKYKNAVVSRQEMNSSQILESKTNGEFQFIVSCPFPLYLSAIITIPNVSLRIIIIVVVVVITIIITMILFRQAGSDADEGRWRTSDQRGRRPQVYYYTHHNYHHYHNYQHYTHHQSLNCSPLI